jgi:hypothetical protein
MSLAILTLDHFLKVQSTLFKKEKDINHLAARAQVRFCLSAFVRSCLFASARV